MTKKRHLKNMKHALRKSRNRIRRLGDSWYSKEWIFKSRPNAKKEIRRELKIKETL